MSVPEVPPDAPVTSTASPRAVAPPPSSARHRPWFRRPGGILAIILLVIVAGLLFSWLLTRMTPSWYRPLNPADAVTLQQADVAQQKVAFDLHNSLQRVPLGEQVWTITQDEVNSLLAIQFAPPLNPDGTRMADPGAANQPASSPFVRFTSGRITLAARYKKLHAGSPDGGVVSVVFSVHTNPPPESTALIQLESVWAGGFPVPKSLVQDRLRTSIPGLESAAQEALIYQAGVKDPSVLKPQVEAAIEGLVEGKSFPLEFTYDRRKVIVKEIVVEEGRFTIRFVPPTPAVVAPR